MGILKCIAKLFKARRPAAEPRFSVPVSARAVEDIFSDSYDFEKRALNLGGADGVQATICFIDGLVSGSAIAEEVIRPFTSGARFSGVQTEKEAIERITGGAVYGYTAKVRDSMQDIAYDLLNGFCALVFDKSGIAVTFEVKTGDKRSIDQPKEEKVVKGAKDAFIEILKTNTMLVRRRMRDPNLKIRETIVGRGTHTQVTVVYLEGFTNKGMVEEVLRRLDRIDVEGVITAAHVEEYLVDNPRTPFPQLLNTERPDKFCLNLLEGRVGILVDGLPMGFLAPGTFAQFFKVPEDLANHFLVASGLTVLRYTSLLITLLLPAFYVAVAMYHQEMLPTKLMQSIIDSKQSVPFPTSIEVIAMLVAFELLQEAGLRLPNPVGETVSIIGALIVGQSAVEAKVVSPVVVIVVALAGIAGYTMPNQDMSAALRLCRFLLVLAAIAAGLFGVVIGMSLLLYHLCSLESYGVAYMTPFATSEGKGVARAMLRYPIRRHTEAEPALRPEEGEK